MKKLLMCVFAVAVVAVFSAGQAEAKDSPEFPDSGWHKGPYVALHGGMLQLTNDTHTVTQRKFNGTFDPAFGLTFGWDIADWIGPMLQLTYATTTAQVGTATGAAGAFPAGTFPQENARQHALNIGLFARATLPYFTRADWQPNMVKIIPYAKLGGVGHAMFVNAPTNNNKQGAYGGGIGLGAGCEFFIWKGLVLGLDLTENIIFQGSYSRDINGVSTKIIDGGTKFQFQLLGMVGWHF
jgi:hypothetical protein